MTTSDYSAPLSSYQTEAKTLFSDLQSGKTDAAWRFKWEHPRFKGQRVTDVKPALLELADAELVIARAHRFETWADLENFTRAVQTDPAVDHFESAADAIVSGDLGMLQTLLQQHPELVRARSARAHHATLLHYIAANGVEGDRQRTPPNAVEITKFLLDAGSEVDALADMYEARCTTMSMLVSSTPPAEAGLQAALAEVLLDYGAELHGPGSNWQSAVLTALTFGFLETAKTLAKHGLRDDLPTMAGLGRLEDTARLLPHADGRARRAALALAAQHGHADVVKLLLDAGQDPNLYNLEGFHDHSTPLHQAVWANHEDVVHLLVERGARLDLRDAIYDGTPLDWAVYGNRTTIADYLKLQTN